VGFGVSVVVQGGELARLAELECLISAALLRRPVALSSAGVPRLIFTALLAAA
jgi:hypothetical protein